MGFTVGGGLVILAKIEIVHQIVREIAIHLVRQMGNSFVGRRLINSLSVSTATGMCSVYATVSNLIK